LVSAIVTPATAGRYSMVTKSSDSCPSPSDAMMRTVLAPGLKATVAWNVRPSVATSRERSLTWRTTCGAVPTTIRPDTVAFGWSGAEWRHDRSTCRDLGLPGHNGSSRRRQLLDRDERRARSRLPGHVELRLSALCDCRGLDGYRR